jgi:ligand-binding sensor domain-containing protein
MPVTRLTIVLLFFQQFLIAQQFNYVNIGTDDGLPSSEVYDILQDKKGYMWFATDHGVARYNGKEFTKYTTSSGLLDNTVFRMCEDSKGWIWFVSQSNEVCYWENNVIHKAPVSDLIHAKLNSRDIIQFFYIDSLDNLWFGTRRGILTSVSKNNYSTLDKVDHLKNCDISFRIVDQTKVFNTSTPWKGIYKSSLQPYKAVFGVQTNTDSLFGTIEINKNLGLRSPPVQISQAVSTDGTIFYSYDSLIFTITKDMKITCTPLKGEIMQLVIDKNDDLWINYREFGVSYFKDHNLKDTPISFLEECTIDDEYIDHEGGVWIATLEKGVFYIPSLSVLTYANVPELNGHIMCIDEFKNKTLVSTYGKFIGEENNKSFTPIDYLCDYAKSRENLLCIKTIRDTIYADFGRILERFTTESGKKTINHHPHNRFGGAKDVFEAPDHSIYILTGGGIGKIDPVNEDVSFSASSFRTTCVVVDGDNILVGGKQGLYLFKNNKYISLGYKNPLLKSQITQMIRSEDGSIWIATGGKGVLHYKNGQVIQFSEADGLISNTCTAITMDQYKHLWVGTNNGLSCILKIMKEKEKWVVKNLSKKNGLCSNEITKLFACKNSLWVGTLTGLNHIDIPGSLLLIPSPPVYISSIKVNDSLITTQTVFPYNRNNLKFTLDPLTFKSKNHLYRYRIVELNSDWQETKTDEILFNSLPPGSYTFEAQVANIDKIWSHQPATYSFTINKPFWFTWWFILLEVLVAVFIVYLIIRWRTSIIRKKEQEKLRINKLLAEYQMKALTAQMNPHFIFNAINSIQNFIIQNHPTLAYDYLIKFSKLIRLVLNNSKENEISLQQELETLAIYVELEQLRFKNSFDYQVSIATQLDTESIVIPALLLQPYIENAIWHGLMPLKNRKGAISLMIIEQNEFLKITITDNGVGRKASDLIKKKIVNKNHQSIGMELTGKRIEVFGQESKFSLQIIDNYDADNEPTGTTVEIILPMIEMY